MKISLTWKGDAAFSAENERGSEIVFDGPPEYGGKDAGMRPMEGMLSAAAACAAFDVARILRKARRPLRALRVRAEADRAAQIPSVFTRVHLHFIMEGDLRESAAERAVSLSVEKYCSALSIINKTAAVSHSWEILGGDSVRN